MVELFTFVMTKYEPYDLDFSYIYWFMMPAKLLEIWCWIDYFNPEMIMKAIAAYSNGNPAKPLIISHGQLYQDKMP